MMLTFLLRTAFTSAFLYSWYIAPVAAHDRACTESPFLGVNKTLFAASKIGLNRPYALGAL